ncbi:MAG TPA: glycerophosphodiester phosphodiesterase family protein [Candidatus Limnocylindrales bacterium]|jgi:glycerophosphoryl diester phosphodiesterase|nr:glycerophosphodiester phosphodiesterase family protein [Candidatus Limnocylindrales bacterium]
MKPSSYLVLLLCPCLGGSAELPQPRHNFIVIAHRGNHAHAHENTLTALQHAIDAGSDYAEIDIRRTLDGHHVLMHDRNVERMTDGHGQVNQLTLAQIRKLSVRDTRRPQIPADRVPTFEEVLTLIKARINIYLDFKDGDRAAVARAIRDAGVTSQILVYDGIGSVPEWHRVAPELPLIVSPPDNLRKPAEFVAFAQKDHIEVLDDSWQTYSRETVTALNRAGVKVWPDIQNDHEDDAYFNRVLAIGVNGVQTDHPETLIAWLKQHQLR